jgi:ribosomal-protein-alanine N-acetyltransferase
MPEAIASKAHIRWAIRQDAQPILGIERYAFKGEAWTEEDLLAHMRRRTCIAMVAEQDNTIVGFVIYELHKNRFDILRLAACPRGLGVGAQLIDRMKSTLTNHQRTSITVDVPESLLDAQLFFRSQRFLATEVKRKFYNDQDAYRMVFELSE